MYLRRGIFVLVIGAFLCSSAFAVQRPQVTLSVTGSITIELYTDKAPVTCANFIKYVQSGFYNNLIFHRIAKPATSGVDCIQAGAFDTDLIYHSPTYSNIINESSNRLSNIRYTIAMARQGGADTASSQFFINDVNNTALDYGYPIYDYHYTTPRLLGVNVGYCVFGRVIAGTTVVDQIAAVATSTQIGTQDGTSISLPDVPVIDIKIQSATVTLQGPVCDQKLAGDIDGDCKVTFKDMALLASNWLQCNSLISQTCSQ